MPIVNKISTHITKLLPILSGFFAMRLTHLKVGVQTGLETSVTILGLHNGQSQANEVNRGKN